MAEMRGMLLLLLCVSHSSAKCGIQKSLLSDILEDSLVHSKMFPWVVSLQDSRYSHLAFGCILSEFWILSSASTFQHRKNVVVLVGIANMDARMRGHTEYPVNAIILHEAFNNHSMRNNIALLKTDSPMQFNDLVQPICFLSRRLINPPTFRTCWVAGWNPTSATGEHMTMSVLRKMPVKNVKSCPLSQLPETACCTHKEEKVEHICLGDPGNPVICELLQQDLWVLRGVLNEGGEQCTGPFVYTRVEHYSDWILEESDRVGPSLNSLRHWEKVTLPSMDLKDIKPPRTHAGHPGRVHVPYHKPAWHARHFLPGKHARNNLYFRPPGLREAGRSSDLAIQPMYYDYYGGESGERGTTSRHNGCCRTRDNMLLCLLLLLLCSGT
ncbi:inactive serine protease 54 [Echinops telfairi]|uniref:Inactive serine protease 54 n=1 Tax=Echinops telfairi TaxID=9371 RepID=A0ABM0IPN8_ECHTE|nr:inactive serine protease 54 [Echinops telfairi]